MEPAESWLLCRLSPELGEVLEGVEGLLLGLAGATELLRGAGASESHVQAEPGAGSDLVQERLELTWISGRCFRTVGRPWRAGGQGRPWQSRPWRGWGSRPRPRVRLCVGRLARWLPA